VQGPYARVVVAAAYQRGYDDGHASSSAESRYRTRRLADRARRDAEASP
jgi:hypothetical protein